MHVPPQLTRPLWHDSEHTPPSQTSPAAQAVPELAPAQSSLAPQYCSLLSGSMHVPPQLMRPLWHVKEHTPPLHTSPLAQIVPSLPVLQSPLAPQYWLFVIGLMHVPSQLMRPLWHVSEHTPPSQTSPSAQFVPAFGPVQSGVAPQ
jgi:hypothetical protein